MALGFWTSLIWTHKDPEKKAHSPLVDVPLFGTQYSEVTLSCHINTFHHFLPINFNPVYFCENMLTEMSLDGQVKQNPKEEPELLPWEYRYRYNKGYRYRYIEDIDR
ncbi:hypothetical protein ACJX0J_030263 [Zea mays]